ncbi:MAG TPA: hypothetical protein DGE70_04625, partial [Gammaproteobacteria bacterium]|nr:hypothetical protein [Gammaproteobacteria bacterium]
YFYTANAKTSGLAALIKDYTISASSTFLINKEGVGSINYQILEQEGKQVSENYVIDINSKSGTVMSSLTKTQPKVITWKVKKGNVVDPLSLFLALSYNLKDKPNQSEFSYQVADGKSVEQQYYKKTENQIVSVDNQTFNAIKVERINSENNNMQAYFLSEYRYLPVIIKMTKGSKKYRYEIKDFKASEVRRLQVSF